MENSIEKSYYQWSEYLAESGYKKITIDRIKKGAEYYTNKSGNVKKLQGLKNGAYKLKDVSLSKNSFGYKYNAYGVDKKVYCRMVANDVYRTFKGEFDGKLQFIDENIYNCNLENLITIKELLDYYNKGEK